MSALVNLQTLLRTLLANTQIGSEKSLFHADIETMDTLTLQLLQPLSKEDSNPSRLFLRSGTQLNQELDGLKDQSPAANLSLISDAILRNLDDRFEHDLGMHFFDSQMGLCIKGRLGCHHVGTVFSMDDSPGTIQAKEAKLQEQLASLGLILKPAAKNRSNRKFVLYYQENEQPLKRYFDGLNANVEYSVEDGIIEDMNITIPIDSAKLWMPEEAEPEAEPISATLTEPDTHRLHKTIKDFLSILAFSYDKNGNFCPIAGENVSVSLFRSYAAEIETIMLFDGQIAKEQHDRYAKQRAINQQARNKQTQQGLALAAQHCGKLRKPYMQLRQAIETLLETTELFLTDMYLSQYGNIRIDLLPDSMGVSGDNVSLPNFIIDPDDRELHIPYDQANIAYLKNIFLPADTGTEIMETQLDRKGCIKRITVAMNDFRACGRLLDMASAKGEPHA